MVGSLSSAYSLRTEKQFRYITNH